MRESLKGSLFSWLQLIGALVAVVVTVTGIVYAGASFVLDLQTKSTTEKQLRVLEAQIKIGDQETITESNKRLGETKDEISRTMDKNQNQLREDLRSLQARLDAIFYRLPDGRRAKGQN